MNGFYEWAQERWVRVVVLKQQQQQLALYWSQVVAAICFQIDLPAAHEGHALAAVNMCRYCKHLLLNSPASLGVIDSVSLSSNYEATMLLVEISALVVKSC